MFINQYFYAQNIFPVSFSFCSPYSKIKSRYRWWNFLHDYKWHAVVRSVTAKQKQLQSSNHNIKQKQQQSTKSTPQVIPRCSAVAVRWVKGRIEENTQLFWFRPKLCKQYFSDLAVRSFFPPTYERRRTN